MSEQLELLPVVCMRGEACDGWLAVSQHKTVPCPDHMDWPYEPVREVRRAAKGSTFRVVGKQYPGDEFKDEFYDEDDDCGF